MRRYFLLRSVVFLAFLTVMFLGCTGKGQKQYPNGRISFAEDHASMGTFSMKEGKYVDLEFTNIGDEPLVIFRVDPMCGCLGAEYSSKPVSPGDKGYIRVSFQGDTPGWFNKAVRVYNSSKDTPCVRLWVSGEAIK